MALACGPMTRHTGFLPLLQAVAVFGAALSFLLSGSPSRAAGAPESLGVFGAWSAWRLVQDNQTLCYMTFAQRTDGSLTKKGSKEAHPTNKRGERVLMITHRPLERSLDVVSYTAGTKLKPGSEVSAHIGTATFNLFTQGDTAWARDATTDRTLAAALRQSGNVVLSGTVANGTTFTDTLALRGTAAAYRTISKACGITVSPTPPKAAPSLSNRKAPGGASTKLSASPKTVKDSKAHPPAAAKTTIKSKAAPAKTSLVHPAKASNAQQKAKKAHVPSASP